MIHQNAHLYFEANHFKTKKDMAKVANKFSNALSIFIW